MPRVFRTHRTPGTVRALYAAAAALVVLTTCPNAAGEDQIFFPAFDDTSARIVQRINAETGRLDISAWYLTDASIVRAIANRFAAGVPVRLIGDRSSIFEIDTNTREQFYWLASRGVPIRLRYNP